MAKQKINLLILALVLLMCQGCASWIRPVDDLPFVEDRFDIDNSEDTSDESKQSLYSKNEGIFEIEFKSATISDLADFFRIKTNYALVSNAEITFSGFFRGAPGQIVADVAKLNNLNFARIGNTYYLYSGDDNYFNVTVVLNSSLSDENLSKIFDDKYLRQGNKVVYYGPLKRALELQNILESVNNVMVNNYVVTVVQVETSAELAYNLALEIGSKGIDLLQPDITAWDIFSAAARVNGDYLDFDSYHERQFYVSDSQKMTYNNTVDKKLENRAVTDQGTSTVTGYQDVQAGAIVELELHSLLNNFVSCSYNIELSNFVADTIDKRVTSVTSDDVQIQLGRVYYLASSQDKTDGKSFEIMGLGKNKENIVTSIYVKIDKIRENK